MRPLNNILTLRKEAEHTAQSLPALIMSAEKIAYGVIHGPHAQKKSGTGEKFWQFREYREGDQPQSIDWRQSAKTQSLYIKQKEWQTTQRTYLWCASGQGMTYTSNKNIMRKSNAAHILTLALAILLTQSDEQVGVFGDLKTGRSDHQLQKIAQTLLNRKQEEPLVPVDHMDIPRHSTLIMTGDFLEPLENIEANFSKLSARAGNALVIQILDPSELNLNFSGRITFMGTRQNEKETVNNIASIRADYIQRIQDHIAGIKKLCREQNWTFVLHRTDNDLTATLQHIWTAMDSSARRTSP